MSLIYLQFTNPGSHQTIQLVQNNDFPPRASSVTRNLQRHQTFTLTQITPIVQTLSNDLYRGTLAVPGKDIPIVVKQSRIEGDVLEFVSQLKGEAMVYCRDLQSCQGEVVPLFYGLYEGNIEGRPLACILLEDCGDPCDDDLKNLDMSIKLTIFEQFIALHKRAHIFHNETISSHMLLHQSPNGHSIRIISFSGGIRSDHQCEWSAHLVPGENRPKEGVSCGELFFLEKDLEIWHNPFFNYKGYILCENDGEVNLTLQKSEIDASMAM